MKIRENTGICIFGIRPLCGGVNLPKWTSFYKSLVKIVYNPGEKTQNVRNFQTKKKKKKCPPKIWSVGGWGGVGQCPPKCFIYLPSSERRKIAWAQTLKYNADTKCAVWCRTYQIRGENLKDECASRAHTSLRKRGVGPMSASMCLKKKMQDQQRSKKREAKNVFRNAAF